MTTRGERRYQYRCKSGSTKSFLVPQLRYPSPMLRIAALAVFVTQFALAQFSGGSIYVSLDAAQYTGVSQIGIPGNSYLSTGEVLAYSTGMTSGARSLWSAEALGVILGDRDSDALPNDWLNVDALHLTAASSSAQPRPYDALMSFEYDLQNLAGNVLISAGDVFRLTGIGTYQIVVSRATLAAAMGTTVTTSNPLNLDGLAVTSDGTLIVSFKNSPSSTFVASCNHVRNPLNGNVGSAVTIYGSDIIAIPQPYGIAPATILWRSADLLPIASQYGFQSLTEVRDFDIQPNTANISNPYDLLGGWASGTRPQLIFLPYGSDIAICTNPAANPAGFHNTWWYAPGTCSTCGSFATNGSTNRVALDALAISPYALPTGSAISVDVTDVNGIPVGPALTAGNTIRFTVRNLPTSPAGATARVFMSSTLWTGTGYPVPTGGFNATVLNPNDAFLLATSVPAYDPLLVTGPSLVYGTVQTPLIVIPAGINGLSVYVQPMMLGPSIFPLGAPSFLRIQ